MLGIGFAPENREHRGLNTKNSAGSFNLLYSGLSAKWTARRFSLMLVRPPEQTAGCGNANLLNRINLPRPIRRLVGRSERVCAYTCLMGRYEPLNEQPVAGDSQIPFLCLTDDPELRSKTWQIVPVEPLFPMDPIRSQRMLKLLPQRFLPDFDFDVSLYIDNSVVLLRRPEEIFDRYFGSTDFALPAHSYRDTVLDEFVEVVRLGFDDPARVFEQLNHLALSDLHVLRERPYWTGVLLRRHRAASVQRALNLWAMHVQRYSRRDQLSVNLAFARSRLKPQQIEIDNYRSWFHEWPRVAERDRQHATRRPNASLGSVTARLEASAGDDRALLQRIVDAQRQLSEEQNG